MRKIADTVIDASPALQNVLVQIYTTYPGTPATMYTEANGAGAATGMYTNANGLYAFYAPDGVYTMTYTYNGEEIVVGDIEIYDDSEDREKTARAVLAPVGETGPVIPSIADRIGKVLGFGPNGAGVAVSQGGADSALRTDLAASGGTDLVEYDGGPLTDFLDGLPEFSAGTYTPTITPTANLGTSLLGTAKYIRMGDIVTVTGFLLVEPTLNSTTSTFTITLPFASDFVANEDVSGQLTCALINQTGFISADATSNVAVGIFISAATSVTTMSYSFTYQVM